MTQKFWISCCKFTVQVDVKYCYIVQATPIVRKFIGQPLCNLERWASKLGDLRFETL